MRHERKKRKSFFQFFTFSMIAGLNGIIDIGTLNALLIFFPTTDDRLLIFYNTIAYTLAVTNSYIWNSRITFKYQANFDRLQVIRFIMQALGSLLISNIVYILGYKLLLLFPIPNLIAHNISKALAMLLSSLASFFFMKFAVFKKQKMKRYSFSVFFQKK